MGTNSLVGDVLPSNLRLDSPFQSLLQGLRCRREAIDLLKDCNIAGKGTGFSLLFAWLCIYLGKLILSKILAANQVVPLVYGYG